MQFLSHYGLFLLETLTMVIAILLVVGGIVAIVSKDKDKMPKGKIKVKHLNKVFEETKQHLREEVLPKAELKKINKAEKREKKNSKKEQKDKRLFLLDFVGDIKASAVEHLREEISAVLSIAKDHDEVLVRLESGGGMVHTYGLAASQLARLKQKHIQLTIAVDKVAASGGYMMAAVADKIISAPFAIIGSIGVLAQIPNFHRFLKKHNIDFEQLSAGEYKRTLSLFGENTSKGRAKLQQELEETHDLFKQFIRENRRQVEIEKLATGEHWFGQKALELKLVDKLITSDDYLLAANEHAEIYQIKHLSKKKSLLQKFGASAENALAALWG